MTNCGNDILRNESISTSGRLLLITWQLAMHCIDQDGDVISFSRLLNFAEMTPVPLSDVRLANIAKYLHCCRMLMTDDVSDDVVSRATTPAVWLILFLEQLAETDKNTAGNKDHQLVGWPPHIWPTIFRFDATYYTTVQRRWNQTFSLDAAEQKSSTIVKLRSTFYVERTVSELRHHTILEFAILK